MKVQTMIIAAFICLTANLLASQMDQDELMSLLEEQSNLSAIDSNSLRSGIESSAADFQRLRQELMFGQMQPIRENDAQEQEAGLNQLIEQLRSLNLPPQLTEQDDTIQLQDTQEAGETEVEKSTEPNMISKAGIEQGSIIERIEKISQAAYPLKLADTLFRQGYFAEALNYYQSVYGQLEEKDVISRQWLLFQMANCLRNTEANRAAELYGQLIEQYPNSAWSSVAAARKTTIEWKQTSQIQGILNNNVVISE